MTVILIVIGVFGTILKGLIRGLEKWEIGERARTPTSINITDIGHNTEKSPGDLRRLVVTRTPVKDHQLTLVRELGTVT